MCTTARSFSVVFWMPNHLAPPRQQPSPENKASRKWLSGCQSVMLLLPQPGSDGRHSCCRSVSTYVTTESRYQAL